MKPYLHIALLAACLAPVGAQAHKAWLLPSMTNVPVDEWITVDASVSETVFLSEFPYSIDAMVITAPDGSVVAPENVNLGKVRNTFDLHLTQPGTYRMAVARSRTFARWEEKGEKKFWPPRNETFSAEGMKKHVPAKAEDLTVIQLVSRVETWATAGKPNSTALKPSPQGLALQAANGVTDLLTSEKALFTLLVDGKPMAGVDVDLIPAGERYRDSPNAVHLVSDAQGQIIVDWPAPGQYMLRASIKDGKVIAPVTLRHLLYTGIFEVFAP